MYGIIITVQVEPTKIEEAISIYRNVVVPAVRQQKGFKGISLQMDRNASTHMRIVVWETEADANGGDASGFLHEQIGKMAPTFAGPPITEHCEISFHV